MRAASALLLLAALACAQEEGSPEEAPPERAGTEESAPSAESEAEQGEPAEGAARAIPAGWPPDHEKELLQENRDWMVRTQLEPRGVTAPEVLRAMRTVPRHRFVPTGMQRYAYEDRPLPIGYDQTISQPYIVASMTESLRLEQGDKALEIGTGSGYQAAVLAQITPWVYTIEIKEPLHVRAKGNLKRLGYETVEARHGDGYYGWPEAAPFDAIVVTAAAPHVPPPLVEQLAEGGRMVIPVGPPFAVQDLRLVTKDEKGRVRSRSLYAVRFVPLTGSLGADREEERPEGD